MKITILGKGAFGSAIGAYLTKIGHSVIFDSIENTELVFVCVPSNKVLPSLLDLKNEITNQKIIVCSKGFASGKKFISTAIKEEFKNEVYFLYGPTLAGEIEKNISSGMVLAGAEGKIFLKKQIESENLYIELSDDSIGVEICATFKNVMALLIGVVEGAGFGQNTNALVFTKAIEEIKNIGLAQSAKVETFLGLACVGDLSLSSRNRLLGIELGKGRKLEDIIKETGYTPAGVFALKDAQIMIKNLKINAPLTKLLYKIVYEDYPIKNIIKEILSI